jgi:hypothetical protein
LELRFAVVDNLQRWIVIGFEEAAVASHRAELQGKTTARILPSTDPYLFRIRLGKNPAADQLLQGQIGGEADTAAEPLANFGRFNESSIIRSGSVILSPLRAPGHLRKVQVVLLLTDKICSIVAATREAISIAG